MSLAMVGGAALLLALERLCYVWAWRSPSSFQSFFARVLAWRDPVAALERLFCVFKAIQLGVFGAWCWVHGDGVLLPQRLGVGQIAVGVFAIAVGQVLNAAVFVRLGRDGVFYGSRFGRHTDWCTGLPFSLLSHPQYVGAVLTIWGLFLLLRFPEPDWVVLPLLETVYYALGARLEADHPGRRRGSAPEGPFQQVERRTGRIADA